MGQNERLLLAETDYQVAQQFRAVAEEVVKLWERAAELYTAVEDATPASTQASLDTARLELKQLNRVCLRHAARRLDAAMQSEGQDSEMESAVIHFEMTHPLTSAA